MKEQTATAAAPRTLYDISRDYSEFAALMDSIDGEITPEHEQQIDAFLTDLGEERDKKLDAYGGFYTELTARGKARKEEGKRISTLGQMDLNKADRLKSRLLNFFKEQNITGTIQTLRFKFRKQNNGGKAPLIIADEYQAEPLLLPEQFVTFEPVIDTDAIRAVLDGDDEEAKEALVGIACYGEIGEHMRIA